MTQLGKLHSLADPLLQDIVKFYSDLGVLQDAVALLNEQCKEYMQKGSGRPQLQAGRGRRNNEGRLYLRCFSR